MFARIAQIETAFSDPAALTGSGSLPSTLSSANSTAGATSVSASSAATFANLLQSVVSPEATATEALIGGDGSGDDSASAMLPSGDPTLDAALQGLLTGSAGLSASSLSSPVASIATATPAGNPSIVAIAEGQVGQAEQPLGSNNGPAIAMYRSAVSESCPGQPWCADFASWVSKQAGMPIGEEGQGYDAVSQIWSWAQQTGRAIPNGPGVVPAPGDLICFGDAHVGIVTGVQPNGDVDTVEGNYDNRVVNNVRPSGEATGYVNMTP
jgi:hypothetical protein